MNSILPSFHSITFKLSQLPVARVPAGNGCRIAMLPLGSVAFPTVGIKGCVGVGVIRGLRPVAVVTKGVRPDIGVKVASPAADI